MNSPGNSRRAVARWLLPLLLAAVATAQRAATGLLAATAGDVVLEDIQYAEGFAKEPRRNRLDLYLPASVQRPPLVMFVHGGMWTGGKKEHGAGLARALLRCGIACACINTQQHPFAEPKDMVADCGRALAWLHEHADEHGYDGDRLFLMGHSSGGHLVSWLALDDERLAATGVPRASVRGAIALSGVYEVRTRHPALDKVFGNDAAVRRDATPLLHASAGDPPMLLLWGERDLPGLSLCGRMLRDRLRELGVGVDAEELAGRDHVDYLFQLGSAGDRVLARIARFVAAPPVGTAAAPPPPDVARTSVQLAPGMPLVAVVRPARTAARALLLWVVAGDDERAGADALARALVPFGVAVARLDGADLGPMAVAAIWQRLRQQAAALQLPAPGLLGGLARGGELAAMVPLGRGDGVRGRIVAGASLGARSLAAAWPGAQGTDVVPSLAAARGLSPSCLLLEGEGDPAAARSEALQVGVTLSQQKVDVHLIEVPKLTAAAALQQLGTAGDVLLPLLRAFVLP